MIDTPIQYLKGIGPKRAKLFQKLGISTIDDLLYYFPRRYEDRTKFVCVSQLEEGQTYTIKTQVLVKGQRRAFKRKAFNIFELIASDDTGRINCVWFNQPYLADYFRPGMTVLFYGRVERYLGKLQMASPEFEIISSEEDESLSTGRIVPIYPLTEKITQRTFRKLIRYVLDEYLGKINDSLPYDVRSRHNLLNLARSLINIHFSENPDIQKQAYERLSFEEFFLFQLPLALRKYRLKEKQGISHKVDSALVEDFINGLAFKLTASQEKVLAEIKSDMAKPQVMQRLLQGDVGSGKTIVATIAALFAIQGGYQAVFMVPTEILAKQHYEKISSEGRATAEWRGAAMGGIAGSEGKEIKIALLTSGTKQREKTKIYKEIEEGRVDLVIGTHALLEGDVKFKNLGLVVIDEQHKFGVGQRALLPQKGLNPDVLIMTATPIPRTLAITLYGDLDISVLNELPPGRQPVKTLHFTEERKDEAYAMVKVQIGCGRQAFIIYPVIEGSYVLDIAGAKRMYEELKSGVFKGYKIGLIHGRLKQKEQDEIMLQFKAQGLDILIATTVLEVGIDIPNATAMVIENAERFGLSQLHQLRGRVGRGQWESFCLLVSNPATQEAKLRMQAMLDFADGFHIAEEDLKIRGPGEFFGRRQHGLSELKIGNPLTQMHLLKNAREEAIRLVGIDARLETRQNILLKERLLQRFPEYEKLVVVG